MADEVDEANERRQFFHEMTIQKIRDRAAIQEGVQGDCELCGEWSGRLIRGACAPCRDRHKLP